MQILFYSTSAKRKMIVVFISHLVWGKIKLFDINRVGEDMCGPREVKFTRLKYHWKTKIT